MTIFEFWIWRAKNSKCCYSDPTIASYARKFMCTLCNEEGHSCRSCPKKVDSTINNLSKDDEIMESLSLSNVCLTSCNKMHIARKCCQRMARGFVLSHLQFEAFNTSTYFWQAAASLPIELEHLWYVGKGLLCVICCEKLRFTAYLSSEDRWEGYFYYIQPALFQETIK